MLTGSSGSEIVAAAAVSSVVLLRKDLRAKVKVLVDSEVAESRWTGKEAAGVVVNTNPVDEDIGHEATDQMAKANVRFLTEKRCIVLATERSMGTPLHRNWERKRDDTQRSKDMLHLCVHERRGEARSKGEDRAPAEITRRSQQIPCCYILAKLVFFRLPSGLDTPHSSGFPRWH